MTNRWVASVVMLCPVQHRTLAAATAATMSNKPADNTPQFFSRPVGAVGSTEATYYLAHSRMRENVLAGLPMLAIQFPGALYSITQHDEDGEEEVSQRLTVDQWSANLGLYFLDSVDDIIYE